MHEYDDVLCSAAAQHDGRTLTLVMRQLVGGSDLTAATNAHDRLLLAYDALTARVRAWWPNPHAHGTDHIFTLHRVLDTT